MTIDLVHRSNRTVLFLQRRSKHNDKKWGLPGGNAEDADLSLLDTAKRGMFRNSCGSSCVITGAALKYMKLYTEAAEEMGDVPDFEVTGVLSTRCTPLSACAHLFVPFAGPSYLAYA